LTLCTFDSHDCIVDTRAHTNLRSGIFIGFLCYWIVGRSWRGLLGSAAVPALILLVLVFLCPESPRFLIRNDKYAEAFLSLRQLRGSDIQAAKDLYYIHSQLQIETELIEGKRPKDWWAKEVYQEKVKGQSFFQRVGALFTVQRNRRACVAAFLVMAAQQLCGVRYFPVDPGFPIYAKRGFRSMSFRSTHLRSSARYHPRPAVIHQR
jgi:hypothetical protein